MRLLAVLFVLGLSGCGGGDGKDCPVSVPLSDAQIRVIDQVKQCSGLDGPLPEGVVWHQTIPCPTSGRMTCVGDFPNRPCPWNADTECGASGFYVHRCEQIHLPDQYDAGFAHEVLHHLLYKNGRPDWKEHTAPEWKCGVVP